MVKKSKIKTKRCSVCGKTFPLNDLIKGSSIRDNITDLIVKDYPEWKQDDYICESDLAKYREKYLQNILKEEKGALTHLEKEVVRNLKNHQVISENIEKQFDTKWTYGERLSDKIAEFGGSWRFIILFTSFMAIWILLNSLLLIFHPFDPYPFILLNLILSTLAALQAPIIMMSQNRQEAKDRLRSQHDYQVNLKAELEIRNLQEKVDHLLTHQWDRLVQIQEVQIELLNEINKKQK